MFDIRQTIEDYYSDEYYYEDVNDQNLHIHYHDDDVDAYIDVLDEGEYYQLDVYVNGELVDYAQVDDEDNLDEWLEKIAS